MPSATARGIFFQSLVSFSVICFNKVAGTRVTSEFIKFDDDDQANTDEAYGAHPYGPSEDPFNLKVYYCYYEPGKQRTAVFSRLLSHLEWQPGCFDWSHITHSELQGSKWKTWYILTFSLTKIYNYFTKNGCSTSEKLTKILIFDTNSPIFHWILDKFEKIPWQFPRKLFMSLRIHRSSSFVNGMPGDVRELFVNARRGSDRSETRAPSKSNSPQAHVYWKEKVYTIEIIDYHYLRFYKNRPRKWRWFGYW